jgi:nucleoredoxin
MDTILGNNTQLLKKDATVAISDLPKQGVIGLYFSAHWCPPCRGFTPKLAEAYNKIRKNGKALEIIFVSSDKDEKTFADYHAEMPWLALPFEKRDLKAQLSKKYKVQGIPSLVLLDAATGKTITTNGREAISSDTEGAKFPWKPPSLSEAMGDVLVKPDGTEVKREEALKGKYVGLYFSAHWCPPCKMFTPQLAELYKKLVATRSDFEIVFVSSDRDAKAFKEYHAEMPWLAVPYPNREGKNALSSMFDVEGIPTFAMIGPDGKTINKGARGAVGSDPEGKNFPWAPKPVEDVEELAGALNETTALLLFAEGAKEETAKKLRAAVEVHAKAAIEKAAAADEDPSMVFGVAVNKEGPITKQIRSLCKLGDAESDKVQMAILDIPDEGGYYTFEGDVSPEAIKTFLADFAGKKLTRSQLA